MADAETAELFLGPISEGLRAQDIESFGESLTWQAEDLRQARGLSEEEVLLDDEDFRYFKRRYRWLRREHARLTASPSFPTRYQVERLLASLNKLDDYVLGTTGDTLHEIVTVMLD